MIEFKHIQANWIGHITWVKVNNVFDALFWHLPEQILNRITVRVDKRKTTAIHHILKGEVLQQHRLTGTGLTDDIGMAAAVIRAQANWLLASTELVVAEQHPFVHHLSRTINLLGHLALHL